MSDLDHIPDEGDERPLKPEECNVPVIDGFLLMFTSLAMILLAFFIMLNTMAVPDVARERDAIGSLLGSFGIMPEGVGFDKTGSYVAETDVVTVKEEVALFAAFEAFLDDAEYTEKDVVVYVDEEGRRRIRFGEQFLFQSGSFQLHPRVFPMLDRLAAILRQLARPVEVEGHTDKTRGRVTNWQLSAHRAVSVVRYLEEVGTLAQSILTAVGFGSTRPAFADAQDPRNRRVEIVVN